MWSGYPEFAGTIGVHCSSLYNVSSTNYNITVNVGGFADLTKSTNIRKSRLYSLSGRN